MYKKVCVIICNYNKKEYVIKCIESVLDQNFHNIDIYVIDNASTDGSVEAIAGQYGDKVNLIVNKKNLGGSGGFNTGMKKAMEYDYEYLILLDNDVCLSNDTIEILYNNMNQNMDIGIEGCKILKMDYPDIIQEFAPMVDYKNMTLDLCHSGEKDNSNLPKLKECDYVPACALIVRTEVIKKIGVMPEDNFIYWDDVEWALRCWRQGYRVVANSDAKVWHKGGSTVATNTFGAYYGYRNKIEFFIKYMSTLENKTIDIQRKAEERLNDILTDVFKAVYACNYTKRYNRAKTIMDAFIDALMGRKGKADDYQIRETEQLEDTLYKLLKSQKNIILEMNDHIEETRKILMRLKQYQEKSEIDYSITVHNNHKLDIHTIQGYKIEVTSFANNNSENLILNVCDHVFHVKGKYTGEIWIDGWCNSILDKKDYDVCRAFEESYKLFKICYQDRLRNLIQKAHKVNE